MHVGSIVSSRSLVAEHITRVRFEWCLLSLIHTPQGEPNSRPSRVMSCRGFTKIPARAETVV